MSEDLEDTQVEKKEVAAPVEADTDDSDIGEGDVTDENGSEEDSQEEGEVQAEEEAAEPEEAEQPKESRSQRRVRAVVKEREEFRERYETSERERIRAEAALHARTQIQQENNQVAHQRAEQERMALMDPSERAIYEANKNTQRMQNEVNMLRIQMQDSTDAANYNAKAQVDTRYAKYKGQVDEMHKKLSSQGNLVNRESILAYIIGEQSLKNVTESESKKKEAAGKRQAKVSAKPASARGDTSATRGSGRTPESRLAGVLI